jgi:hypothetical protein
MESPREALCDACLAVACGAPLAEMRALTARMATEPDIAQAARCAGCRRIVAAIAYQPKCVHCSLPVGHHDLMLDGDAFHLHCLRRLIADETIQTARVLSERSRVLIEQSRRRLYRAVEPRPAVSATARRLLAHLQGGLRVGLCSACAATRLRLDVQTVAAAIQELVASGDVATGLFTCSVCHRGELVAVLRKRSDGVK